MQTHHQALEKGQPGTAGRRACAAHVVTLTATQAAFLAAAAAVTGERLSLRRVAVGLTVNAISHDAIDRRDHKVMPHLCPSQPAYSHGQVRVPLGWGKGHRGAGRPRPDPPRQLVARLAPRRQDGGLPRARACTACATLLIHNGASVKAVQMALGHSTPMITLNEYVGEWPEAQERTRTIVDTALGDVPSKCLPARWRHEAPGR